MGFLGFLSSREEVAASIRFGFGANFEATFLVSVTEQGRVPDGCETWIWDLFYAKALYTIGRNGISEGLKQQLETWAEKHTVPLLAGFPVLSRDLACTLDPDLELSYNHSAAVDEAYDLEIVQGQPSRRNPEAWPTIRTRLPRRGLQNRFASTVIALAQHFISKDTYFTRMLPFHILTMRKFHKVRHDYYSARSLVGAPTFAVEEEIDWNANAQRRIIEALNSEQPNA